MFIQNGAAIGRALMIAVFAAVSSTGFSQQFNFTTTSTWVDKPVLHTVNPAFDSAAAIGILDEKKIEYTDEGKEVVVYASYHRIIKIKDDKGIEMFNKV